MPIQLTNPANIPMDPTKPADPATPSPQDQKKQLDQLKKQKKEIQDQKKQIDQSKKEIDQSLKQIDDNIRKTFSFICALRLDMVADELQKIRPDLSKAIDTITSKIEKEDWIKGD